jgi:putative endonuclease
VSARRPGRDVDTPWFVYLAQCADGSVYCGVSRDLARRQAEHNHSPRGARYTRSRRPVRLCWCEPCDSRGQALRQEAALKRQPRAFKLLLCGLVETAPAPTIASRPERETGATGG